MIPYLYLGRKICTTCNKTFEFDMRLVKRVRVCDGCKKANAQAREKQVNVRMRKQRQDTNTTELARLAVRTYEQVGAMMNPPISAEAVRKIEMKALEKLRLKFAHIGKELFQ